MGRIDDYLKRHELRRRADYDQWFNLCMDTDAVTGKSIGVKFNPLRNDLRYVVVEVDDGKSYTTEYLSFEKARNHFNAGAGRRYQGDHLVH